MGFENVLYEINDGILYLTLNRPEARNALTPGMWKDIQAAVEMARFDDNIKVVIVSGSGDKALASGADIQEIHDRETLKMLEGISTIALKQLEDLYKPVICASTDTPSAADVNWQWPVISESPRAVPNLDSRKQI